MGGGTGSHEWARRGEASLQLVPSGCHECNGERGRQQGAETASGELDMMKHTVAHNAERLLEGGWV